MGGTLPQEYSAWSNLTHFSVTGPYLEGSLPSAYSAWTRLQTFQLTYAPSLTGSIPPEWIPAWAATATSFTLDSGSSLTGGAHWRTLGARRFQPSCFCCLDRQLLGVIGPLAGTTSAA